MGCEFLAWGREGPALIFARGLKKERKIPLCNRFCSSPSSWSCWTSLPCCQFWMGLWWSCRTVLSHSWGVSNAFLFLPGLVVRTYAPIIHRHAFFGMVYIVSSPIWNTFKMDWVWTVCVPPCCCGTFPIALISQQQGWSTTDCCGKECQKGGLLFVGSQGPIGHSNQSWEWWGNNRGGGEQDISCTNEPWLKFILIKQGKRFSLVATEQTLSTKSAHLAVFQETRQFISKVEPLSARLSVWK